jgi:hypothetical protein
MITLKDYLKYEVCNDQTILSNIKELLKLVNELRTASGLPFIVTSGLRTKESQIVLYQKLAKQKGIPFDESKVPLKSKHISGQAIDIFDPQKELQQWCLDNEEKLEDLGLYCEDFSATPNWVHFQTVQPKSGKRFFIP